MSQRILMPGEIEKLGSATIAPLLLPALDTVFAQRAARLRHWAPNHAMQGYLELLALVAQVQQELLLALPVVPLPVPEQLTQAKEFSMPPLAVATWVRDPSWQSLCRSLVQKVEQRAGTMLPAPARQILQQIANADAAWLERQASEILNGIDVQLDRGAAPFVAAALQVYWSAMVIRVGREHFLPLEHGSVCPCCGSRPTASIVRLGEPSGHRYLHCSLCAAQWHLVRIKCSQCDSTEGIEYLHIADRYPAARAECCPSCHSYLKIFYQDKDQYCEPIADDVATLGLDLMLSQSTDKQRVGVNFALFQGEG